MRTVKIVIHTLLALSMFACAMTVASKDCLAQAKDSGVDIRVNFRLPLSGFMREGYPEHWGYSPDRPSDFCFPDDGYSRPDCYYSELDSVTAFLAGFGAEFAIGYRWKYFGLYIDASVDVQNPAYIRGSRVKPKLVWGGAGYTYEGYRPDSWILEGGGTKTMLRAGAFFTSRGFIPINDAIYIDLAFGMGVLIGGFDPYGFPVDYCCPTMFPPIVAFKGNVGFTYFLDEWFGIGAEVTCSYILGGSPPLTVVPALRTVFQF